MCTNDTTISLYMPHMDPMQSTMWPGTLVYIIEHYWHILVNKYASHITHICPTVLPLWSTYRSHTAGHTNKKTPTTATSNYHAIAIYVQTRNMLSNATCMPHMPITYVYWYKTTMSVYMPHMNSVQSTVWPQTPVHIHSHYWYMPLNKYESHIVI